MSKGQTLQDPFLNALRKDRIPVSIFLVNGIKLQGQIESFDQYAVLLKNTVSQMVYKHAISTIVPTRNPRADGTAPAGATGYPAGTTPNYPMGGGTFERQVGSLGGGFDRSGFGTGTRQGGFTRTPPNSFGQMGGFERGGYPQGGHAGGFERSGFDNRGFGGFDRSNYEERGFDGKTFDSNPNNKTFDGSKGFDLGGFDKSGFENKDEDEN